MRYPGLNLNYPDQIRGMPLPTGCVPYAENPLLCRFVRDFDWPSLIINMSTVAILFLIAFTVMGSRIHNVKAALFLSFALVVMPTWLIAMRGWADVKTREAKTFRNPLTRTIDVLFAGFHFTPWYYRQEDDVISFQKHEVISRCRANNDPIVVNSMDGYSVEIDIKTLWKRRDSDDALNHSLRFTLDDLRRWIEAVLVAYLSDVVGMNTYADILRYKAELTAYAALIFGGDYNTSLFEAETGTDVKSPVIESLTLTSESAANFANRSKVDALRNAVEQLSEGDLVSPEAAARLASLALGIVTQSVHTYEGIPQNATVVALGDSGVAIATGRGGR